MKSFKTFLKSVGRKAIGYIRGLNGKKTSGLVTQYASSWSPAFGAMAAPLAEYIGESIDKGLGDLHNYLKKTPKINNNINNVSEGVSTAT